MSIHRDEFMAAARVEASEMVPHLHRLLNASLAYKQDATLSLFLELLGRLAESFARGDYRDAKVRFQVAMSLIPKDELDRFSR